jgi:2,4-dienoyl-CoA reductase-like NADH-dependent reductase (Old Yellow Enzyme family)
MRFPLEVFTAVRAAIGGPQADLDCISPVDWIDGGTTIEDVTRSAMLRGRGTIFSQCRLAAYRPAAPGRWPRLPGRLQRSDRNELGIPTMAVGGT